MKILASGKEWRKSLQPANSPKPNTNLESDPNQRESHYKCTKRIWDGGLKATHKTLREGRESSAHMVEEKGKKKGWMGKEKRCRNAERKKGRWSRRQEKEKLREERKERKARRWR